MYNPIFGNAQSIFMGRSIKTGSTTDYKFSFPAFTFNTAENDQLHMVSSILKIFTKFFYNFWIDLKISLNSFFQTCSITICPADNDCIQTSYSAKSGIDDDSCDVVSTGYKSN